jgi:hypothetical protein
MPSAAVAAAAGAARAAATAAAGLGVTCTQPEVLHDGANVIVRLSPSPVVAKVAASSTVIRADVADWLQRELDVAAFLTRRGAPVLAPSPEMPATTYQADGHIMSFWRYLQPASTALPDEDTIGSMLRDLHAALRHYPGVLPVLAPLRDIPAFLARPATLVSARQAAALAAAYTRLTAELDLTCGTGQMLHGDAGSGNLMAAVPGWVWHDFEDACSGPVGWDLAAATGGRRLDPGRVLAAYGDPFDASQLAICQQLRRLHLTVWYALYAERLPDCGRRAAELLATWPAP